MVQVLYQVTYSGVVVECWSGELQKLTLLDLFGEGRLMDLSD